MNYSYFRINTNARYEEEGNIGYCIGTVQSKYFLVSFLCFSLPSAIGVAAAAQPSKVTLVGYSCRVLLSQCLAQSLQSCFFVPRTPGFSTEIPH